MEGLCSREKAKRNRSGLERGLAAITLGEAERFYKQVVGSSQGEIALISLFLCLSNSSLIFLMQ